MEKPSCFLSCSFRNEDRDVITFFKNLLKEEFKVLTAEPEDSTDLYEKIFPKIRNSKVYFIVFSKRGPIKGTNRWTPLPDALTETGFALALERRIFGFVEEEIHAEQLGLLRFSSTNYPRFKRSDLESNREKFSEYIRTAAQELANTISPPWEYTQATKEVTVYCDGYGVIRHQVTLQFSKHQPGAVIPQFLSGGKCAKNIFDVYTLTAFVLYHHVVLSIEHRVSPVWFIQTEQYTIASIEGTS